MTTISGAGAHASVAGSDRLPASKAGTKGYLSAEQLRAFADSAIATKTALKAKAAGFTTIARTAGRDAAGDGGGGSFRWSSADLSADVTADTREIFYIAPDSAPTGASGAWVRDAQPGFLVAEWAGAYGDDTTDCAAAWAALEIMADRLDRATILWLGAIYRFNSALTQTKSGITHVGSRFQTYFRFNHTNDGITLGSQVDFVDGFRSEGISWLQASGSAYAINYYNAREVSLADFEDSQVRNFAKLGSAYTAIIAAANNGAGLVRITLASDAFVTGSYMWVNLAGTGVTLSAGGASAGAYRLTRISSGVYDLVGSVFGGAHASVSATGAVNNGSGLIRVTLASDALVTGSLAYFDLSGAGITGGVGAFLVNRISSGVYDLRGSTFGGTYTSGGTAKKAGRAAAYAYQLHVEIPDARDAVKVAADKAFLIQTFAGDLIFNGLPSFQSTNVNGSNQWIAGTAFLHWAPNTTAFDRFDHVRGRVFGRRFERGLLLDNTRAVSVYMPDCMFDACGATLEVKTDAVDATLGGFEKIKLSRTRGGYDSGAVYHFAKIDCTGAVGETLDLDGIEGDFEREAIIFAGGTAGLQRARVSGAQLLMRPQSSTYDAISVSGKVDAQLRNVQIKKQSGAGSLVDGVQVAATHTGRLDIGGVQLDGGTGYCVAVATGLSRSTSIITVELLENLTTPANRLSDADNTAASFETPYNVGRKWTDIAAASSTNIGAADGDFGDVTGSGVNIADLGSARAGVERTVRWTGSNTLNYDATKIITRTKKLQTQAGDTTVFRSLGPGSGSGSWVLVSHRSAGVLVGQSNTQNPVLVFGLQNASTVADDTAISMPAFEAGDTGIIQVAFSNGEYAIFLWETTGTPSLVNIQKSANVDLTTGALTGTTGTDGKTTIAITVDGTRQIYIENRSGGAMNIRALGFGSGGV